MLAAFVVAVATTAATALAAPLRAAGAEPPRTSQLDGYYIDPENIHVSGISAGAYMAVQLQVAFSSVFRGSGSIAGGPYYCAEADMTTALTNCMTSPSLININRLIADAEDFAARGEIDDLANLNRTKHYIFAGTRDTTVNPGCSEELELFLEAFVPRASILTEYSVAAGHAHINDFWGNTCGSSSKPYINDCNYDAPGILLAHVNKNALQPRGTFIRNNLHTFDQSDAYKATGLAPLGYIYIPSGCEAGELCGLHVALHGCIMSYNEIDSEYVEYAGYNEWAESNNLIVLYPQIRATTAPYNPNACWDWWGYAGTDYSWKSGTQMAAIRQMIADLSAGGPALPQPEGVVLLNATDSTITLGWGAVAEAAGYHVYRGGSKITTSAVGELWYTDAGLPSGTAFSYTVAAVSATGGQGPQSSALVASTTGNPPPLGAPQNLRSTGVTATTVSMAWDVLGNAASYRIYRDGAAAGTATAPAFTSTGLAPETRYSFAVSGVTAGGEEGPVSSALVVTTPSDWNCQEYFDDNYQHVVDDRAYTRAGYVYAVGSDDFMGLYNIATYTRLAETAANYFVVGEC